MLGEMDDDGTDVDLIDAGSSDKNVSSNDAAKSSISKVKEQVGEVMDTMRTNMNKVLERGDRLDDLNERSEELSNTANVFQSRAKGVRRTMWIRTCRVCLRKKAFF